MPHVVNQAVLNLEAFNTLALSILLALQVHGFERMEQKLKRLFDFSSEVVDRES